MPVVLVHGNPETEAIWDELRTHLGREDVIALSPPGFGAPVPDGFEATSDGYLAWLIEELEAIDGPIDVVGHDWGGGHVMRLAMERPDLIRSWSMDIAGCFDPEYVWHDAAQGWQTPDVGEDAVAGMAGAPVEARTAQFEGLGMSPAVAKNVAEAVDETMGRCILSLYRSAAQPALAEIGKELGKAKAKPGLVIIATEDHYTGGEVLARRSAERAGATVAMLEGRGHWWMCEDPKQGAEMLNGFLAGIS
jgi:pimeloyl-ACP methyl ester carboxylesterase